MIQFHVLSKSMALRIDDIPFQLRAGDIVKHVINIDSRFREAPETSTTSDFYFRVLTPIRNVLRIRISSIEFPNNYYIFSQKRRNVSINIVSIVNNSTPPVICNITIPDGNYSAYELCDTLNPSIQARFPWLTVTFDQTCGKFTFKTKGNHPFSVDTVCNEEITYDRPFDYGLGFNMGLSRGFHMAEGPDGSGNYAVISDQLSYFAGDAYGFLKINNFDCVRQTTSDSEFTALAKVILRDPKNFMSFDDYSSQQAKEVTFPAPYDLARFKIQVLDPYGVPVDMGSSQFAFSMEVLEVRNLNLYNTLRNAFAADWRL